MPRLSFLNSTSHLLTQIYYDKLAASMMILQFQSSTPCVHELICQKTPLGTTLTFQTREKEKSVASQVLMGYDTHSNKHEHMKA